MSAHGSTIDPQTLDAAVPSVAMLASDTIARFCLAAHAYLSDEEGKQLALEDAGIAIDVASSVFERVKERLRPEERLALTQLLTEIRMTFVKKRGL